MEQSNLTRPALFGLSIALILIWGSAYTFVGVGVDHISPIWLVAGRMAIGATLIVALMYLMGERFPPFGDRRWVYYGMLGMTGSVLPFFLLAQGQLEVDSGLTSIITGALPLFTILLAHVFTNEKLTAFKSLGFIIGFIGVTVLFLPDDGGFGLTGAWGSQLMIVGAAMLYALTTVAAKRAPDTSSVTGAAIMLSAAAVVSMVAALLLDPGGHRADATAYLMIGLLGVGSTGIATVLYLYVIEKTGPSVMARLNYFVPLAGVAFGIGFLGEAFTWKIPVAFGIIFVGVLVSRIGVTQLVPKTPSPSLSALQTD